MLRILLRNAKDSAVKQLRSADPKRYVGVHHAFTLYIVCHLGLLNSVVSFPARFQQLVNVLHLVNVVLCHDIVVHR